MSRVNALTDDVKTSFRSLLSLDTNENDMRKLAEDKVVKGKVYANVSGDAKKSNNLIVEIGSIIQKDIDNDNARSEPTSPKSGIKTTKVVTTKDYIKGISKEKKNPSVNDLLNNPLRDSYSGLEYGPGDDVRLSAGSLRGSRELKLTAKDLNRSISKNLDISSNSPSLLSKKDRNNLKGSVGQIVNTPLRESTLKLTDESDSKKVNKGPLGATAKLLRSFDNGLNESSPKEKKKSSSKQTTESAGSALSQIHEPLRKSLGHLGSADLSREPLPPKSKNEGNAIYTASSAQKKKHSHEKVDFDRD